MNKLSIDLNVKKFNDIEILQNIISESVLYTTSDIDANITSVSKAFEKLTGYSEKELIGKNHNLFRDPKTPNSFYEEMWDTLEKNRQFKGELKNYTKNKDVYWTSVTINPMFDKDGIKIGYAAYRENITNTKKLEYLSTHDTLTNIYNREYFNKTFEHEIKNHKRYGHNMSLILVDIDHFKNVNDTYGHNEGDKVLTKIAEIIKNNLRENDIVARWGGEEFVILLSNTKLSGAFLLAEKLRKKIEIDIILKQKKITASFGVGMYTNKESKTTFFEKIDNALYSAKDNGRNCVVKC